MTRGCNREETMHGLDFVAPDIGETDVVAWQVNRARYCAGPFMSRAGVTASPGTLHDRSGTLRISPLHKFHPGPILHDAVVRHVI